jgi:hypothetical protein
MEQFHFGLKGSFFLGVVEDRNDPLQAGLMQAVAAGLLSWEIPRKARCRHSAVVVPGRLHPEMKMAFTIG